MGFFQDLKEDLSLAVNELLPEVDKELENPEEMAENEVKTKPEKIKTETGKLEEVKQKGAPKAGAEDKETALSDEEVFLAAVARLDENADIFAPGPQPEEEVAEFNLLLGSGPEEEVLETEGMQENEVVAETENEAIAETETEAASESEAEGAEENEAETEIEAETETANETEAKPETEAGAEEVEAAEFDLLLGSGQGEDIPETENKVEEEIEERDKKEMKDDLMKEVSEEVEKTDGENELEEEVGKVMTQQNETGLTGEVLDETAIITAGMKVTGNISSQGSMDILGTVKGNVEILGKLNISGGVEGNSIAEEIFADSAKITGEVHANGSVKVGQSSVIIGNIYATSAVIAGAVKGDIDVQGPVILDTSAIVMGNIKSKSVQINNGAVIEGMCSQCYADVNPSSFFKDFDK